MPKSEKWAANIAFVGDKEKVKKILKLVEEFEEQGDIEDYTGIDGPYDSLQLMLKRRAENLALEANEKNTQKQLVDSEESSQNEVDGEKEEDEIK